ncbi:hypothetical protein [Brevibacillus fortis]|uniref:hypothetical protein n=1 Tax=Brevibacillus fortis TaxID=2126352 RepID=UPI0038FC89B6
MEVIYAEWHANYDELILGQKYTASKYKAGWVLIESTLYREECFQEVKKTTLSQ